jgi:acetyltransferase
VATPTKGPADHLPGCVVLRRVAVSDLSGIFDPRRVAVVGATDRAGSVGRALLENLSSFEGEVIPVNPNRESVLGMTAYDSIAAVESPDTIDLTIVAVPATAALTVLRSIGEAGIENVVVITAGFGEAGAEGEQRAQELTAIAREYDLNLVGPNCVGVINTRTGLNATFVRGTPREGSMSLVSQSGAFIAAVLGWAEQHDIGFNHVLSLGNEAVIDEIDVIAEWGNDPETDVILAYLEDIDDGRTFVDTARAVTGDTPLVVIKSGRTEAGAAAAASHTGAIAGSDVAYQAAFDEAGVYRATEIKEAFEVGRALASAPVPDGDDIAVVTNGGGPGVLATDAIGDSRLEIAEFGEGVTARLSDVLPDAATVGNPLDIIGDADIERFRRSLDTVLGADEVDGAVVISVPTALFDFRDLAAVIGDCQRTHGKPVVACLMGGADADAAARTLDTYDVPSYFEPARAVSSLEALADYRDSTSREAEPPATFDVDRDRAEGVLDRAAERGVEHLSVEAMALLEAYGIHTPAGEIAESAADAERIAADIGAPVVMKIASPDILHKSDIGGVEVGVPLADVGDTYRAFVERARNHDPDARILGVQVEEQVAVREATETIVGVSHDQQFGHLVMFGLGGIFVQVFEDTAFRLAPVSETEARAMTAEIQAAPMLRGARGREPADIEGIVDTIQRVSQLVTDFPRISELDINPLIVGPDGVCAVDLRVILDGE